MTATLRAALFAPLLLISRVLHTAFYHYVYQVLQQTQLFDANDFTGRITHASSAMQIAPRHRQHAFFAGTIESDFRAGTPPRTAPQLGPALVATARRAARDVASHAAALGAQRLDAKHRHRARQLNFNDRFSRSNVAGIA